MYTISKTFEFSASHRLLDLPDTHPCSRNHGHNYIVRVVLEFGTLDQYGFVVDYGDLKPLKEYIDNTLDHRYLNEVLEMQQTTAEKIAKHLYEFCEDLWPDRIKEVQVSETPKTWASYSP